MIELKLRPSASEVTMNWFKKYPPLLPPSALVALCGASFNANRASWDAFQRIGAVALAHVAGATAVACYRKGLFGTLNDSSRSYTMQLVPQTTHGDFPHAGGVSIGL